jgi:Na+-translocating ferredoxin:NAD+ oxidoreductase RnfC subunit
MKLGITKYSEVQPEYLGEKNVERVRIRTNRHIGATAKPLVHIGQRVQFTDLIAQTEETKLGSNYHASIDGVITDMTETMIEITSEGYTEGHIK